MNLTPDATLPQFRERLEALLRELRLKKASQRVLLYLDLRAGEVVDGGEVKTQAEPWVER